MRRILPQSCRVVANRRLNVSGDYFRLTVTEFKPPIKVLPGQFIHAKVGNGNDPFFRRAFSIADYDDRTGRLDIIYRVVGRGTACLAQKVKNNTINLIGPLGRPFSRISRNKMALLVAGGIGLPPLYFLARYLIAGGHDTKKIVFFYGGRSRVDLIELARLRRLGVKLILCTDDGSYHYHGMVTEAVDEWIEAEDVRKAFIYGCGPEPMLAALQAIALEKDIPGELSLEAPMPCGVGVCLGCIKRLRADPGRYVRVCCDGPVFDIGEVKL